MKETWQWFKMPMYDEEKVVGMSRVTVRYRINEEESQGDIFVHRRSLLDKEYSWGKKMLRECGDKILVEDVMCMSVGMFLTIYGGMSKFIWG